MLIGINYPWINYGWDFGDPPRTWVGGEYLSGWREQKRKQIEADFRQFASVGIFAIRWFLLGDGTNYGTGDFAPRNIGNGWTFDPLPVGHPFHEQSCADFEFVLQCCANSNLKFFPSLIDFNWCRQGATSEGCPRIVKGGRYEVIRDPIKREAFLDRVLRPLLEISTRYRDSIYAWELINEPEWVTRKSRRPGRKGGNRTVSLGEMKDFISCGIGLINAGKLPDGTSMFRSSVGFAHWDSLVKWNCTKLGITQDQFHYYAQESYSLPTRPHSEHSPCILGEFATAAEREWPDLTRLHRDQTLANRLRCIEEKGYPACFLWSARAADPATRWTAAAHQEIATYLGSGRSDHRV